MTNEPKDIDVSKELKSNKYERFCQEYVKDNNGSQAAIRAGYSEKGANSKASQLLSIISIFKRIEHLHEELSKVAGVDALKIIKEFKKIGFGDQGQSLSNRDKISALTEMGKHIGFYGKDNEQRKQAPQTLVIERPEGADDSGS